MSKVTSVRLTDQNIAQLDLLKQLVIQNNTEINDGKTNYGSLINFVLSEYFDFVLDSLSDGKHYSEISTKIEKAVSRDVTESKLENKINILLNENAEIYYLLMATNQTLAVARPDNFKEVESMFKDGTRSEIIHKVLATLVKSDRNRNALLNNRI